nr:rho GTPase-activating protein 24 [Salvelinus alpinus]
MLTGGDRERMTANHETYLLMASTQNDMEDWVKTIRRVIWAPFGGGIFGQKLEETVRYERRYGSRQAPMLVEQCVGFIRKWGLREEGLFRLPGQANLVKELQDAFDCGEKPSFDWYVKICYAYCKRHEKCVQIALSALGMKELKRQVECLPPVNYNLLQYICRFLDEVQSYSGVNKMSVQNLATVFGPNILRPKIEDPVAIMEGTVLVQQLMSVLIGRHDVLFPRDEDSPKTLELVNNNNEVQKRLTQIVPTVQTTEQNNNTQIPQQRVKQCSWETPESPHRQPPVTLDNNGSGSPRSASPLNGHVTGRFDLARSPPLTVKKNPAVSKGSGVVTNGSFSCSPSGDAANQEKSQTLPGGISGLQARRTLKGSGTKMGTSGVPNGGVRMGVSSTDVVNGTLNGRNGLWVPNGYPVTLRDSKSRDCGEQTAAQNRLSTYDNVQQQQQQQQLQNQQQPCLSSSCEDKQSVDSATWSTSSCEISLPDNSTSCRSSTTTCPEQDFYGGLGHYQDPLLLLDGPRGLSSLGEQPQPGGDVEGERRNGGGGSGGRGSGATSSSDNSETFPVNKGPSSHSALHSLVASLKHEMQKQKTEYEARITSLEHSNLELETEMGTLHEELNQEKKKVTMVEIKFRNAERAKDDAEKRNDMLQKEMEQFFSTFGDLTDDPRRPDRANTIWIQ